MKWIYYMPQTHPPCFHKTQKKPTQRLGPKSGGISELQSHTKGYETSF